MFFRNELLFNNVFLSRLTPSEEERGGMYSLIRAARDWYRQADFSQPSATLASFVLPLLRNQSLDLVPIEASPNASLLVAPWDPSQSLGLLLIAPQGHSLDGLDVDGRIPKGQHWMVMAVDQARQTGVRWVILTNGDQWRLLDAQGLRRYEAFLEIDLAALVHTNVTSPEFDQAAYLFYHLFRLEGAFSRQEDGDRSGLDDFYTRALQATEKTERYLKQTVCDYLNTPGSSDGIMAQLCVGLVKAIDPDGTHSFTAEERDALYMDATYLLYRLLFVQYAEARGLLPAGEPEYRPVSLANILEEALAMRGDPSLAGTRPTSLWDSLAALFNFIDIGDTPSRIPAFDGGLFDNKARRYLGNFKITNQYLAEALCQLAFQIDPEDHTRLELIDYCDLSVRHLGSLYEGMIEYRLFIAEEDLLARQEKEGRVRYLPAKEHPRKPNDEMVAAGKVYFAQSPHERKATGTHYTPEELVERLVTQTVLRLLNERWLAFEPQFQGWLREIDDLTTPDRKAAMRSFVDTQLLEYVGDQVLSLSVCDPAMGSGHFLVHTAHQITNAILHTLARTSWDNPELDLNPAIWKQHVVENCLYGVDINPVAVELAKLSLWLASMQADRPLTFLDHHLKTGNSLLGVTLEEIQAVLETDPLKAQTSKGRIAEGRGQYSFRTVPRVVETLKQAGEGLGRIAQRVVERVEDVQAQEDEYAAIQAVLEPYKRIGDLLVARKMGWEVKEADFRSLVIILETGLSELLDSHHMEMLARARILLNNQQSTHWLLEFPQIFWLNDNHNINGFDIVIGNPPFLSGARISSELGDEFLDYLISSFKHSGGRTDLCAYFFRLGYELIKSHSYFGFIATNTIAQGDTRQNGLAQIERMGAIISFADKYVKWPGDASVEVNLVALYKLIAVGEHCPYIRAVLDGNTVPFISSWLDDLDDIEPHRLGMNSGKTFEGDKPDGIGFLITPEEANWLVTNDPSNLNCIFPFISGMDVNDHVNQEHDRFVICFHDWSFDQVKKYPDLLQIVEERVKPHRLKIKRKRNRERWWLYGEYRKGLRKAIEPLSRVLVRAKVSEYHMMVFVPRGKVMASQLTIFVFDDYYGFGILQSNVHESWLRRQAPTLESRQYYTTTDCFDTFSFPQNPSNAQICALINGASGFYEHRQQVMQESRLGLTKTYNRFHDPVCQGMDILEMRRLYVEMDRAVLSCYGWEDIDLQHDFYPNDRKKTRYMPSREAQREIFTRLLALNQQVAAQEAAQGLSPAAGDVDEEYEE